MKKVTYKLLEDYMKSCMEDSAHDKEHIYRVLYHALAIADTEKDVDYDVLIAACLLHDIGRGEQFANPKLDHAEVGAQKAYRFLLENHFPEEMAVKIHDCIRSHRFRNDCQPESIEAKILFDADKIDVSGAIGIARTLIYKGQVSEPLYSLKPDGTLCNGKEDPTPSFFHEYEYKLKNIYNHFYTEKGGMIARERQAAAVSFYQNIFHEVNETCRESAEKLGKRMEE